ncbi:MULTISPECIES: ferritin-like domain-containing protein [Methylomonas]|uniref:ferritin-like domain-containing protein n=1 Tax=Methylomonas TaxID=416 RepID=UPI00123253F0|nr:ferritin-like domain-containing protein [Methylomonas rhizoryzae]
MNNFFTLAEQCLFDADIERKIALTIEAQRLAQQGGLAFADPPCPRPIAETCFPQRPLLLMPRDMPRRRLDTSEGRAAFFHALAHIEFMAIYLAWDIAYRFRGLPVEFCLDWLKIAAEEAEHFALLRKHLQSLGYDYGDLPAHKGLWSHAEQTAEDILARLAVVPRCLEARGLDVTPAMIDKLRDLGDHDGVAILSRIYHDEIGHVERGSYWLTALARRQGLAPEQVFKEKLLAYFPGKPKGPFNRDVRIIAGFSQHEIDWLEEGTHE